MSYTQRIADGDYLVIHKNLLHHECDPYDIIVELFRDAIRQSDDVTIATLLNDLHRMLADATTSNGTRRRLTKCIWCGDDITELTRCFDSVSGPMHTECRSDEITLAAQRARELQHDDEIPW